MTWKRILIITAVSVNVLALILPGGFFVWGFLTGAVAGSQPMIKQMMDVMVVVGFLAMAVGIGNIICVRCAVVSRGCRQNDAITAGCVLNIGVVGFGLLLTVISRSPFPWMILVTVGCTTAAALLQARTPEGICEHCGYDLTGLKAGTVCPECGTPTEPKP